MGSGSTCAVVCCHNNSWKMKMLSETYCAEHKELRQTCPCPAPYAMHSMPRKEERKLAWLAALNLKHPPKRVYVCSFHFVDKKPTELHPDPELYLGYEQPPPVKIRKRRKRKLVHVSSSSSVNDNEDVEDGPPCWTWVCHEPGGHAHTPQNSLSLAMVAEGGGSNAEPKMEKIRLDELSLGAALVVQADGKEQELYPTGQTETPGWSINGAVTVETREAEERRKREERLRQLYPELKKCVVVIARPRFDKLEKLKEERREEEEKGGGGGGGGGGGRSGDPEPESDWMKPLEMDDIGGGFRRFVKKVEVKVSSNPAPASRRGRSRRGVLRLTHGDVTTDPAHNLHSRSAIANSCKSPTDHSYSFVTPPVKSDPDGDTPNSQSQDASLSPWCEVTDNCNGSTAKKNVPNIVFKKVGGHQWVLGSEVKKEEEDGDISINNTSLPMKMRKKVESPLQSAPTKVRRKRRGSCKKCAACLREDCGNCVYCLDKRKFGGPETKKQKCLFRTCITHREQFEAAVEGTPATPANPATPTNMVKKVKKMNKVNMMNKVTRPYQHQKRQTYQKDSAEEEEEEEEEEMEMMKMRKWWRQFGKNKAKTNRERDWTRPRVKIKEEEENKGKKKVKKRRRQWFWPRRKAKRRQSEDEDEWTPEEIEELEKKMQEEETEKETHPPQFPAFAVVSETGELLTGTHIQLNLTLDGNQLPPSILSDSTLTLNGLSGLLPQDSSVVQMSTDLTYVPPPAAPSSLHPLLLQPKDEEEAVDIGEYGRTEEKGRQREDGGMTEEAAVGWMKEEEEEAAGRIKEEEEEEENYYEIEVEVPGLDSDEETLTPSSPPSETTEVANVATAKATDDVTAQDLPQHVSLVSGPSSGSLSLLGGRVCDEVRCGRELSQLLQELRRTVLPAHWVAVLTEGPQLQLLQCSRLSSMVNTIIHIQPDRFFYITVQNQQLPDTHTLYGTHTQRITHTSQLVSLLLELEGMAVCQVSRVQSCDRLVARPPGPGTPVCSACMGRTGGGRRRR